VTTIRVLATSDDRSAFRSGDPDLDRFFAKYAGQNQFRHHIGTTYVAVGDDEAVLGYATVSPASIEIDALPQRVAKRLPAYPMPVLRLARLATDERARGRGVGTALLRFVLDLALRLSRDYGCLAVVVDAKPGAVDFYAGLGFEVIESVEGASAARPEPTLLVLPVTDIAAAVAAKR
jgi:GNAT superfamily N-acetyltransferase